MTSKGAIMRIMLTALVLCAIMGLQCQAYTAGDPEFRGWWITAWSTGFLSQSEVDTLLGVPGTTSGGQIRDANCNAVVVQVRRNCDACYPSSMGEPYMSGLSPSNFNALQAIINAAHDTTGGKKRIDVHCWMVTFRTSGGTVYSRHNDTPTGSLTTLDNYWPSRDNSGAEVTDKAFDPGHPLAEDYTVNVAMDLVNNFDIDGIHFDYIRFTANNQGYNPTSIARYNARYGKTGQPAYTDEQFKQWRRDQVSAVVRKVYAKTQAVKPWVKLSGAFVTWNPSPTASTRAAFQSTRPYYDVYSDWDSWLQEGIVDAAMPMTYYDLGGSYSADWTRWINWEKDRHGNRHMYIGPGLYLNSLSNSLTELQQTRTASPAGKYAEGWVGYDYQEPYASGTWTGIASSLKTSVTPTWADVPDMPWKSNPTKGHISGTVTVTGTDAWADGATVTLTGPENRSQTCDGTGFYAFIDLTPGSYTVTTSYSGYPNQVKTVDVGIGSVTGNMYVTDFCMGANPGPSISGVQASGLTTTSATIAWITDQASTSKVDYGTTTSYGSSTPVNATEVTAHSMTLTGLTPGTLYHYRVVSQNANGSTTSSDYTFTTVGPPAITAVQASAITNNSALISWTTDQSSTSQVSYGTTTSYGSNSPFDSGLLTAHSVLITGLSQNTTYHYRVTSTNANGSSSSVDYTFTTTGPPTISGVQVTNLTSTAATIVWTTSAASDSKVDYGLTSSYGNTATSSSQVTSHSVNITGLTAGTTYHYQCASSNAYGTATSVDLTFTTNVPPTISSVQAGSIASSSAVVTWTTSQAADSKVNYGTTTSYGGQASDSSSVTSHSVTLSGLAASTTYHYQCVSTNANGTATSIDYTFTTAAAPAEVIVDETAATWTGTWTNVATGGYNGAYKYIYNRKTSQTASCVWTPSLTAGNYSVYVYYPSKSSATTKATYTVYYDGGSVSKSFNQTTNTDTWNLIASDLPFAAGTAGYVRLYNNTGESSSTKYVVADAVKFVYSGITPPPTISAVTAAPTSSGATITWNTDLSATSQVEYGPTTSYGSSTTLDSNSVLSHSVQIVGLSPTSTYHYRVISGNANGTSVSGDYTFTTTVIPSELIVDDTDVNTASTGAWTVGSYAGGNGGTYKFATSDSSVTATFEWQPNLQKSGTYDLYCWYTSGTNRSTVARYTIYYAGGSVSKTINQSANGGQWISLASGLPFAGSSVEKVVLDNQTSDASSSIVVIADAIKWVYVGADSAAPSVPAGLSVGNVTASSVSLSWAASTDNFGVAGYKVYRDGVYVGSSATTSYTDNNLTANTPYAYSVSAYDNGSNESPLSGAVTKYTLSAPPSTSLITCDKGMSGWSATQSFVMGNQGFGAGKAAAYRIVWDNSPVHIWTDTESTWNTTSTTCTATDTTAPWYFHIKGYNGDGVGNGTLDLGPYNYGLVFDKIADAMDNPDGTGVIIEAYKPITAVFDGLFYIEEADRTRALRVDAATSLGIGANVKIGGRLAGSARQRSLTDAAVVDSAAGPAVLPLGFRLSSLGGTAPNAHTAGLAGANGAYNVGLLVRVAGEVKSHTTGSFVISDGSGASVTVYSDKEVSDGWFIGATGICEIDNGARVIRCRTIDDIQVYSP